MILKFRSRKLKRLYEKDDPSGVDPSHVRKLRQQLTALDAAEQPGDMTMPGWKLHPLKGEWSVHVSGKWVIPFKFEGTNATDVKYEDYYYREASKRRDRRQPDGRIEIEREEYREWR